MGKDMDYGSAFYENLVFDEVIDDFGGLNSSPALQMFVKKYAKTLEGNDRKAAFVFCHFETLERVRALQLELLNIKKGSVSRAYLRSLLGPKRSNHLGSYEDWARRMLMNLSSKNKQL